MKKFLSIITSAFMAIALFVGTGGGTSLVVNADGTDGKITITNTVSGEKYDVYKIFDATTGSNTTFDSTTATGNDTRNAAYTYTTNDGTSDAFLTALLGTDSPFNLTQQGSSNTYNVELKDTKTANDITTFLNGQLNNISSKKIGETHTAEASTQGSQTGNNIVIDNLAYGYYYITTTTGSAVTINSAVNEVTVADKNSVPSIGKMQSVDAGANKSYAADDKSASIGDTVYYQITITAGKNNNADYTVTDTLSTGLTLGRADNTITNLTIQKVTQGTGTGIDVPVHADTTAGYTVSNVSDSGFTIKIDADYVKTLNGASGSNNADTIVIKYSATVNPNAVIAGDGNTNTAELKYSNQTTTSKTTVKTYQIDLVKTKAKENNATTYEVLPGAQFKLYKGGAAVSGNDDAVNKADGATAIRFKKTTASDTDKSGNNKALTDIYTVTTETGDDTTDTIEAGNVRIIGLGAGTYALEETEAPSGYNKLTYIKKVTVGNDNNVATVSAGTDSSAAQYTSGGVQVINNAGSVLPSTGGIGTTIFYVAGIVLVIGAAALLITKKKKNA